MQRRIITTALVATAWGLFEAAVWAQALGAGSGLPSDGSDLGEAILGIAAAVVFFIVVAVFITIGNRRAKKNAQLATKPAEDPDEE